MTFTEKRRAKKIIMEVEKRGLKKGQIEVLEKHKKILEECKNRQLETKEKQKNYFKKKNSERFQKEKFKRI